MSADRAEMCRRLSKAVSLPSLPSGRRNLNSWIFIALWLVRLGRAVAWQSQFAAVLSLYCTSDSDDAEE